MELFCYWPLEILMTQLIGNIDLNLNWELCLETNVASIGAMIQFNSLLRDEFQI